MTLTHTAPLFAFRFRTSRFSNPWNQCSICGGPGDTVAGRFAHSRAVHEVWALEAHGMHAVTGLAREHVETWAASAVEDLPTNEEVLSLLQGK